MIQIKHVKYIKDSTFVLSLLKSFSFFIFSIIVGHFAVIYATANSGISVGDIILDNIKAVDTSYVHEWVAYYLYYFIFILLAFNVKYLPFSLNSIGLLILTRSFFVNLTKLGIPQDSNYIKSFFTQGGDLFFSGHVALPFILSLIFWNKKILRVFFLSVSVFMGVSVLLGHQHYSIDVFAAPFIAYGVFKFSQRLFKRSYVIIS